MQAMVLLRRWRLHSTVCFAFALFTFLLNLEVVTCFNLDLSNAKVFRGQNNSDFGYSVALYLNRFTGNKLIVGAPRASTTALLRQNISNSGAIYGCSVVSNGGGCQSISVDDRPNGRTSSSPEFVEEEYRNLIGENRSGQMLGASLATSRDGVIATCAPLYVNYGPRATKREPVGDCWVSKDAGARFTRVKPCLSQFNRFYKTAYKNATLDWGWASYHKTGHGMCGFSVALGPGNELGLGAPGNYYFHGSLYSVSASNDYRKFVSTTDGPGVDDNNYMTWDIKYGEFDDNSSTIDYVVSAPRAAMLNGTILTWSKRDDMLVSVTNITGEQTGSYFGYALAVGDFNADGLDDIAVGAPLFADYDADLFEIGQVTIFYQDITDGEVTFPNATATTLKGEYVRGRFGLSLANVADLNLDGIPELMVGAPYGGDKGRGVVYLYHGSEVGLSDTPIQVIHSEEVSRSSPPLTFGWSITGNMDVDNNLYPDVAVGAYKSDTAVLFKTRPLITIKGSMHNLISDEIKLPVPCSTDEGASHAQGFELNVVFCVEYEAIREPREITLDVHVMFDSANNNTKRAFLSTGRSSAILSVPLKKNQSECHNVKAYIQSDIRDKSSPLNISLEFELARTDMERRDTPQPILNQLAPPVEPMQLQFIKSCGQCNPDLAIAVSTNTLHYILGTNNKINLTVTLGNRGEDSYLTFLNVTLPDDVSYVNTISDDEACLPIACRQISSNETGASYLSCDTAGHPFPKQHTTSFIISTRLEDVHNIDDTELVFSFSIHSNYAEDTNPHDNIFELRIPLKVETSIFVTGESYPADAIMYNTSHISSHYGPLVEHKYEIYTKGPSVIGKADLVISWPIYATGLKDYLLYIYEALETVQGNATCTPPIRYANPQNLSIENGGFTVAAPLKDRGRYQRAAESGRYSSCNDGIASCIDIRCTLTNLRKEQSVIIKIRSFLWVSSSFKNLTINYTKEVVLESTATVIVTDVPYKIKPKTNSTASFPIMSYFEKYRPPKVILPFEWKWIAIGVGCGLLLLIIIIIVLWRCGFFKRYRPYAEAKVEKHKDGQPHEVERLYSSYR